MTAEPQRAPEVAAGSIVPPAVSDEVLDDLRRRLHATRQVPLAAGVGWDRGTDADYLAELVVYWADHYDWRAHEDQLRSLPWAYTAGDPGIRAIHRRADKPETSGHGDGADAPAVLLLHGWPDSFLRFSRVWPLLTDTHVIVPCLPGYPYADPLTAPGMSTAAMADAIAASLTELGYDRVVVSGGDVGSSVAEQFCDRHRDRVAALHLTDVPYTHIFTVDANDLTSAEQDYLRSGQKWQLANGAYALEQSTRPHSLAPGLGDSPAGLAAWIVEKLREWSDCGGDVESVFPRDELLTWITLYWVTGAIGSSFTSYVERAPAITERVEVPTAVDIFPGDLVPAPREFAERFFDLREFVEHPNGGHFAAWERPEEFVAGLRRAIALT